VPYEATLRVASHEGSHAPRQILKHAKKHPGYSRNDLGVHVVGGRGALACGINGSAAVVSI
jgi:hypothetical protein